jgi:fucose permease
MRRAKPQRPRNRRDRGLQREARFVSAAERHALPRSLLRATDNRPVTAAPSPDHDDAHHLARARHATHAAFFVFGVIVSTLGVHVPSIRAHYRLDDSALAIALLAVAVGAVLCLVFAGRWIAAFGVRRVAAAAACVMGVALALLLQFDRFALLLAVMLLFGASVGLFDVAINTEGTFIESALQRKVMSTMHGMWSLGGMAGAALVAWCLERQLAPLAQMRMIASGAVAVALLAVANMLAAHALVAGAGGATVRWSALPRAARRSLVALGVLAVLGLLAEGAIYDWSTLFLQRERGAPPALAAIGFACFSAAMAAGRFGGDWLRERMPPARLLRATALLAACAMAIVLLSGTWPNPVAWALAGLGLLGLGLANIIPLLFVAASRIEGVSAAAGIALVSSLGWVGVVIGPPLVGGVAQASSLAWALWLVVASSLVLALAAKRVG